MHTLHINLQTHTFVKMQKISTCNKQYGEKPYCRSTYILYILICVKLIRYKAYICLAVQNNDFRDIRLLIMRLLYLLTIFILRADM